MVFPIFTNARPSEKDSALSNCGLITTLPVFLINPHFSPISTVARPSVKLFAQLNRGLIIILPVLFM